MLTIKAKENATIEVVDGSFPLGNQNTIKVIVEDDYIKELIDSLNDSVYLSLNNLYTYGSLNRAANLNKIQFSLEDYTDKVNIDFEKGLNVYDSNCTLKADKHDLIPGKTYTISCDLLCSVQGSELDLECLPYFSDTIICTTPNEVQKWSKTFIATNEQLDFSLDVIAENDWYIQKVQLYSVETDSKYPNLGFCIRIENPIQNTYIDTVVSFSNPTDEEKYIILYMPPITTVDYQDNLLCRFQVYTLTEPKNKFLGDTIYHKNKTIIYNSDCFVLNGYMIPPTTNADNKKE